ncbi:lytic transglycosylase domain-containing protein [Halobacillus sp. MO56]
MKSLKKMIQIGATVFLVGLFFFVTHILKDDSKTTAEGNDSVEEETNEKIAADSALSATPKQSQKLEEGYYEWHEMELTADRLVKESQGRFKKSWAMYLVREAERYEIDPFLVYELLKVETGDTFNPELVGPATKYGRAYGMAQFMKNTAPWIADMGGLPYKDELLFDPYYSMQLSMIYLDYLHGKYGNWNEALTAYHRGMGGLENYKEKNGHARSWYAVEIQENAETHPTFASAN